MSEYQDSARAFRPLDASPAAVTHNTSRSLSAPARRLIAWGGVAGILAGVLGAILDPTTAAAAFISGEGPYTGWIEPVPPLVRPLRFLVEPLLGLAPPAEIYPAYGRTLLVVYLLILLAFLGLQTLVGEQVRRRRWGQLALRLTFVGLVMQVVGNIGDYWLGEEVLGQPLWGINFGIGTVLGFLVYTAGAILLGSALLRHRLFPAWGAWPLIVAPPLGAVFLFWVLYHMPSSWVLPISLSWLVVGLAMLNTLRDARQP